MWYYFHCSSNAENIFLAILKLQGHAMERISVQIWNSWRTSGLYDCWIRNLMVNFFVHKMQFMLRQLNFLNVSWVFEAFKQICIMKSQTLRGTKKFCLLERISSKIVFQSQNNPSCKCRKNIFKCQPSFPLWSCSQIWSKDWSAAIAGKAGPEGGRAQGAGKGGPNSCRR